MSGGLDSFILWRLLGYPRGVYMQMTHRYQEDEMENLRTMIRRNRIRRLPDNLFIQYDALNLLGRFEREDAHIPLRNLMLVLAAFQDADTVILGAVRGEASRDKGRRFLRDTARLASYLLARPVRVVAPADRLTKRQLVKAYLDAYPLPGDRALLSQTRSCYTPHVPDPYVGCGRCQACFRRWVAMKGNGIDERYQHHPADYEVMHPHNWRQGVQVLLNSPPAQWLHMAINNWEAQRVLRAYRQERSAA